MSDALNVILFGEAGSGKSSVVNMIAGKEVAKVSDRADGCTMSFTPYTIRSIGKAYHIWDTLGLDKATMEAAAFEQAVDLIHHLISHGGVDLLILCIRAPRITTATQANYRLFYEVLCRSQVPIAFVITHLEREPIMENWWTRNAEQFKLYGLKCAAHACVTALPTEEKYRESQDQIAKLLVGYDFNGRFAMPAEGWTIEFLRSIGRYSSLSKDAKRREIIRVLVKRCRMALTVAQKIADKMEEDPREPAT